MLWGAQLMTPSFAQLTPEDWNFLDFAGCTRLGLLPATVVVKPEWLTPVEVAVPQSADMEALMARLAPGHPRIPLDTPIPEKVSVPLASLSPLSLVHPLMISPFLEPETEWHIMHAKADAMGMTQQVVPFLN